MSLALDLVTIIAVSAGAFFFCAGTVGLLRFPDTLTRLHALTKADNLGLGLVVLGLLPLADGVRAGAKLICVWLLVLLAGASVSQLIARAARDQGSSSWPLRGRWKWRLAPWLPAWRSGPSSRGKRLPLSSDSSCSGCCRRWYGCD